MISRDKSKLEKLRGFVSPSTKGNLTTLVGNVGKSFILNVIVCAHIGHFLSAWVDLFKHKLHLCPGSEEEAEEVKQTLLKSVGKITDIVSSLGFSWWQRGPPHTQPLKELHWVSILMSSFIRMSSHFCKQGNGNHTVRNTVRN